MDYNYVEVDKEFFPTRCKNYDKNVKIEVRMLTVGDAKLLAMIDENNSSNILYQILKRCTRLTNLKLDDMYIACTVIITAIVVCFMQVLQLSRLDVHSF